MEMERDLGRRVEHLQQYRKQYEELRKHLWTNSYSLMDDGIKGSFPPGFGSQYIDFGAGRALNTTERLDKACLYKARIDLLDGWIADIDETIRILESAMPENPSDDEKSSSEAELRRALVKNPRQLLLVEGALDVEYFELLRNPKHGQHQLKIEGTIAPYGGFGALRNSSLLGVILGIVPKVFVTYDLDAEREVKSRLCSHNLQEDRDFAGVGIREEGRENVEGLIPDDLYAKVVKDNPDITRRLSSKDSRDKAKEELKRRLLEVFRNEAVPGDRYFGRFHGIVKKINSAFEKSL